MSWDKPLNHTHLQVMYIAVHKWTEFVKWTYCSLLVVLCLAIFISFRNYNSLEWNVR